MRKLTGCLGLCSRIIGREREKKEESGERTDMQFYTPHSEMPHMLRRRNIITAILVHNIYKNNEL